MDSNLLTNKIISVVVALVVALCVLVPVANSYGGGGSGDSGGESITWHNIGVPMSPIDINDHSKEYVFTKDDVANLNDGDSIILGFGGSEQGYPYQSINVYCYPQSNPTAPFTYDDDTYGNEIRLRWNEYHGDWEIVKGQTSELISISLDNLYIYDTESNYIGYKYDMYNAVVDANLTEYRFPSEGYYNIIGNFFYMHESDDGFIGMEVLINLTDNGVQYEGGIFTDNGEYGVVSISNLTVGSDGKLNIGDIFVDYNGQTINQKQITGWSPQISDIVIFAVYAPATVIIENVQDNSTGTIGTLIQIIPLFVILGILLSVTTMMVGKGRFGLTE